MGKRILQDLGVREPVSSRVVGAVRRHHSTGLVRFWVSALVEMTGFGDREKMTSGKLALSFLVQTTAPGMDNHP